MAKRTKKEKKVPPKDAAVIYARFSTKNQKETSIDAQINACRKYASENNLKVIKEYIDREKSATTIEKREDLQELIADSAKGEFSKVLVFSLDRFSRNVRDYLNLEHDLKENGVSLYSLQEHVEDSDTGRTLAIVLMLNAEMYVKSVKIHERKTLRELAEKGKYLGGGLPLGFSLNDKNEYIIHEENADIVRKIFKEYASGKSYNAIIAHLNSLGYRTEAGNKFEKNSLYGILKNEKYIGTYIYQEAQGDNAEATEPFRVELKGHLPKIIDEDLFEKVQEKLKENKATAGQNRKGGKYLLSGFMKCECGANMYVNTSNGKYPYSAYRCSNAKKKQCDNNNGIRREFAERYALGKIFQHLLAPNSLKVITARLNEHIHSQAHVSTKEIKGAKNNLNKLNKRIQNLNDSIMNGTKNHDTERDLEKLSEEKIVIKNEIAMLQKQNELEQLDEEGVWGLIDGDRVKNTLLSDDAPVCREFVRTYVNKIVVFKDSMKIYLNLPRLTDEQKCREAKQKKKNK